LRRALTASSATLPHSWGASLSAADSLWSTPQAEEAWWRLPGALAMPWRRVQRSGHGRAGQRSGGCTWRCATCYVRTTGGTTRSSTSGASAPSLASLASAPPLEPVTRRDRPSLSRATHGPCWPRRASAVARGWGRSR
jgi:hypothetical protein